MFDDHADNADDSGEWDISYTKGPDGIPTITGEAFEARLPTPDGDGLCCVVGPCRHYTEQLVPSGDENEMRSLRRYCRQIPAEHGDWNELTDGSILACGEYAPPWWSFEGWAWKGYLDRVLRDARTTLMRRGSVEGDNSEPGA